MTEISGAAIAGSVRTGRASAVDAVQKCLDRIDALDAELHAFAYVRREEGLAEAATIDARADRSALALAGVRWR